MFTHRFLERFTNDGVYGLGEGSGEQQRRVLGMFFRHIQNSQHFFLTDPFGAPQVSVLPVFRLPFERCTLQFRDPRGAPYLIALAKDQTGNPGEHAIAAYVFALIDETCGWPHLNASVPGRAPQQSESRAGEFLSTRGTAT
jgi:hypothetical protein